VAPPPASPAVSPERGRAAKPKRPVDPEKPKRPASGFILYLKDYRARYTGPLKGTGIVKAAGAEWRGLAPSEQCRWEPPRDEMAAYKQKMTEYNDSGKKDAWKRDPARAKLPMTAFLKFAGEVRLKHPDKKMTEQTKLAAGLWKHMSAAEKAPYESGCAEAKERYKAAMEQYRASGLEKAWNDRVGNTPKRAKEEALKLKRAATAKKKKEAAALKKQKQAALKLKRAAALKKKKEAAALKKQKQAEKKKAAAMLKKQKAQVEQKKKIAAALEKKIASEKRIPAEETKQNLLDRPTEQEKAAKEHVVREKSMKADAHSQREASKN